MIKEYINYPKYYGDTCIEVYSPRYYIKHSKQKDDYSAQIVYSKSENKAAFFIPHIDELIEDLKKQRIWPKMEIISLIPQHVEGSKSPTLMSLGQHLSETLKIPFAIAIKRVRVPKKKNAYCPTLEERYAIEKDSMAIVDATVIKEKNVLLLDDVKTTGLSIMEASKVLRNAGAKRVFPICLGINK